MSYSGPHPVVLAFPYLPLRGPIEFGPWWLGVHSDYKGPWLSPEFREAADVFVSSFRDPLGRPLKRPSLLARSVDGADGRPPTDTEYEALELAVGFATISQNPFWTAERASQAWDVATSDNAALWIQPLDVDNGWISLGRGSRVATTAGGTRLDRDSFLVPAPLELHMPFGISLDEDLVPALYRTLNDPPRGNDAQASRVRVAVRWLLRSWQNTPSITWQDRLVFVKIASEALTGEDSTVESARRLEALFERAASQEGGGIGTRDLIWQPDDPPMLRSWTTKAGKPRSESVSAFVHWYSALGDTRNALVHGDDVTSLQYEQDGSRYVGPLVEIGDRVLREAILVTLGELGHPAVWRHGLARASFDAERRLRATAEPQSVVSRPSPD